MPSLTERIFICLGLAGIAAFYGWLLWVAAVVGRVSEDAARLMPD